MKCSHCGAAMKYLALSRVYQCSVCGQQQAAEVHQVEAEDKLDLCITALRFYADQANYAGGLPILADQGTLARETLSEITGI